MNAKKTKHNPQYMINLMDRARKGDPDAKRALSDHVEEEKRVIDERMLEEMRFFVGSSKLEHDYFK
ncbi:MAG: hypothetical protein LBG88_04435 [Christensenellaceae bacterium]|jgi:hypothetical protein|nr:hypothetical protein [Christensenellaceae bacterium]